MCRGTQRAERWGSACLVLSIQSCLRDAETLQRLGFEGFITIRWEKNLKGISAPSSRDVLCGTAGLLLWFYCIISSDLFGQNTLGLPAWHSSGVELVVTNGSMT